MKSLTLLAIYILSFIIIFCILSCVVGLFMQSYIKAIESTTWLGAYTLFFGWWMAVFPTKEYYKNNETYFNNIGL